VERLAAAGKINSQASRSEGFEVAPQELQDILAGRNAGKTLSS
jgi:NADPH-dependent curcumin reductase CurA